MHILIATDRIIPVSHYGGIERVIWYLGHELTKMKHQVTFLAPRGSSCPFARVVYLDKTRPVENQIPSDADVAHFNFVPDSFGAKPYVVTMHGNKNDQEPLDANTIFISRNHAERFGSDVFVYNGLDWDDYGKPGPGTDRSAFHFLGNAAWRVKNVRGAIRTVLGTPSEKLDVLGGYRLNIKMGFRLTLSPRIRFHGMVGGEKKLSLLKKSKGLVFPVLWNEPFGLAITESLYFGAPLFGTPYGSLPELVTPETGFLATSSAGLSEALLDPGSFSREKCSQRAIDLFSSKQMAAGYLALYEKVLNGKLLNDRAPKLQAIRKEKFLPWS